MTESEDLLQATMGLLERIDAGDRRAQEELFQRFLPQLTRFLAARSRGSARDLLHTQDAVQEVVLRAFRGLDRFDYDGVGSFWAWLRTIAVNLLRDEGRRTGRRGVALELAGDSRGAPSDAGRTPAQAAELADDVELFDRALHVLPERERRAVMLRVELGLDFNAIASDCGFRSADAARMSVRRSLDKLAEEMARE